jgi:hypothetical protein
VLQSRIGEGKSMLKTVVGLTLMFRVGSAVKAKKELQRTEELLNQKLCVGKCERYWKIPELWTCDASMDFEALSEAEQIAGCLIRANRLAYGWYVLGPHFRPDGSLESFGGIFDRRHQAAQIQSLDWAHFQVI